MTDEAIEFWQNRYAERDQIWSGRVNPVLGAVAESLSPGRALDLGCGEGGDSIWLAERGWQVTGVDISATAVERARRAATDRGVAVDQIDWYVEDLSTWEPDGQFDFVSACFLHSPVEFPRTEVLQRVAGAVAPAGHLLIVGHAEPPPWSKLAEEHDAHHDVHLLGPDEELAELDLDAELWVTVRSELLERDATGPDGQHAMLSDAVLLLRRR